MLNLLLNRITQLTTTYHLWCAEQELRLSDSSTLTAELGEARAKNIAALCAYRKRGEFPRNRHDPNQFAPCFIDDGGCECAVAHLMIQSGGRTQTEKITTLANFDRIREMHFPELDDWCGASGLTKAELARIQPAYAPTPEELRQGFHLILAVWLIGSMAIVSIVVNSLRLAVSIGHQLNTSLVGLILGSILIAVSIRFSTQHFAYGWFQEELLLYRGIGILIGVASVAASLLAYVVRSPAKEKAPSRVSQIKQLILLAVAFLAIPTLIYFEQIGPTSDARFALVHQYGHSMPVLGLARSADDHFVVTVSADGYAILWDWATGKRLQSFYRGHTDTITSVAMNADGSRFVTGSVDKTAVFWDTFKGTKIRMFHGHDGWVNSVAMSADGKLIATGSDDRTVILWNADSGKKLHAFFGTERVSSVALSGDGKSCAAGFFDGSACLWETESGIKLHTLKQHSDNVAGLSLSADGKLLVTGSWDHSATLWDCATGKVIQRFQGHSRRITSVAISDDGKQIVTGSTDNMATLWNAASGERIQGFRGHLHPIMCVAISSDGKQVVTGSGDITARIWDAAKGRQVRTLGTLSRGD